MGAGMGCPLTPKEQGLRGSRWLDLEGSEGRRGAGTIAGYTTPARIAGRAQPTIFQDAIRLKRGKRKRAPLREEYSRSRKTLPDRGLPLPG